MCGLAGILTAESSERDGLVQRATEMGAALYHRGPDDEGVWVDADHGIALAFRRLSIIDLSADGHQPMRSRSGRFQLVFNGEIYNYRELRRELEQKGARFAGQSDTEVILAAFEAWGLEASLRRFIGMFAMALWDRQQAKLHLMRDRLGKKPLYIYHRGGLLLFGSELKAIFAHPSVTREINPEAVAAYLRYLYVPAPMSILAHVQKLPPGHILTITDVRQELPETVAFWSLEEVAQAGRQNEFDGDEVALTEELHSLLKDAVALRMRADVPVGAFLSGGIDSSLVVSLMQACTNTPVRTFTIGFDEPQWNEAEFAAAIAQHLGTAHTSVMLTGRDALDLIPDLPRTFDEPLADPSQIPTFLVSQVARRDVTVALSGDGGDELFAGYNRYLHGPRAIRRATGLPGPLRRILASALHARSPEGWDRLVTNWATPFGGDRLRLAGDKLHKLGDLIRAGDEAGMYRSLLSQWQNPETVLKDVREPGDRVCRILREHDDLSLLGRMMLSDQLTYLPDDLLAKVDRASMAVSLEARVPILDHRVVEFAWRVPDHLRIRNGATKWPLRRILERYVPVAMFERPKMGFSVPVERWLRGPLRDWADDLLAADSLKQSGLFNAPAIISAWTSFRNGRSRAGMAIWAVLVFQAWQHHWMTSNSTEPSALAVAR